PVVKQKVSPEGPSHPPVSVDTVNGRLQAGTDRQAVQPANNIKSGGDSTESSDDSSNSSSSSESTSESETDSDENTSG
ncbi:hypothetical protein DKP78_26330, partial [Enterococcus faecium]